MANGHGPKIEAPRGGLLSETRFSLLEQRVGGIETAMNAMTSKIDLWMTSRTTNPWRVVALLLGVLVPLGFILNLYITSAISPWAAVANQAKASAEANTASNSRLIEDMGTVKSQNADSKRDREDKGVAILKILETQSKFLEQFARADSETRANEREIETQIDAMNQALSIQFANQQRINADFQNTLHDMGAKMPVAPNGPWYFPNISDRDHHAGSRN